MPSETKDLLAFVIPSYRRPEECMKRTVSLLAKHGIKPTVYLSDPSETKAYEEAAQKHGLEGRVEIAPGKLGLSQNRNHIRKCHPEGSYLVCLDDDVKGIQRLAADGKKLVDVDLQELFKETHAFCQSREVTLWGGYPVANGFFMSNRVRFGNYFIYGSFFMEQVSHDPKFDLREDFSGSREDIERTLIHGDYGLVSRFEFITHRSDYRKLDGGLQALGRGDDDEHLDWIFSNWGHKTLEKRRTDGSREVKLLTKPGQGQ